jgi:hypothetical protein
MLSSPSIRKIIALQLVTLGVYQYYWFATSKKELNAVVGQSHIPTVWMMIIPGLNFFWIWQYARALELVTLGRLKYSETFLLYVVLIAIPSTVPSIGGNYIDKMQNGVSASYAGEGALTAVVVLLAVWFVCALTSNTLFIAVMQRRIDAGRRTLAQ